MTTGKMIASTIQTFFGKVTSLLFNMLSGLVIAFLPRNKCLLISWLQSPSAVILEPKEIKSVTVSIVSPSICHEAMEPQLEGANKMVPHSATQWPQSEQQGGQTTEETVKVKVKSLSPVFATPWTVAYQVPPSKGFSRQEY